MSQARRILSWGRLGLAAIGMACLLAGGCRTLMGENFSDDMAQWGEHQRAAETPGNLAGWSTKGQQVERNLGVR